VRSALVGILLLAACGSTDLQIDLAAGPTAGGDHVRLTGEGFQGHGPAVIHLGQVPAKSIVIESDRLIRFRTPEVPEAGAVDLTVTFSDGTTLELPSAFNYEDRAPGIEIKPRGG
jgi:hypothetical protein